MLMRVVQVIPTTVEDSMNRFLIVVIASWLVVFFCCSCQRNNESVDEVLESVDESTLASVEKYLEEETENLRKLVALMENVNNPMQAHDAARSAVAWLSLSEARQIMKSAFHRVWDRAENLAEYNEAEKQFAQQLQQLTERFPDQVQKVEQQFFKGQSSVQKRLRADQEPQSERP